jgi:hypothetical protein
VLGKGAENTAKIGAASQVLFTITTILEFTIFGLKDEKCRADFRLDDLSPFAVRSEQFQHMVVEQFLVCKRKMHELIIGSLRLGRSSNPPLIRSPLFDYKGHRAWVGVESWT